MLATQELLTVYLGVRLGLYEELHRRGPATPEQLAQRLGLDRRYLREWLEQQAVAGLLEVTGAPAVAATAAGETGGQRSYALPEAHREVLTVSGSPLSMVSLTALPLGGVAAALPRLLEAFRTGAGVADEAYGDDWRHGHGGANRALFDTVLPGWLAQQLPELARTLREGGGRVADVGCGAGWAGIALAATYPGCTVDGFDLDARTLDQAQANAVTAGVAGRLRFHHGDAADAPDAGHYDLVLLLDAVHEVTHPVAVLRACRRLVRPGGTVLLLDARVQPEFTAPGDEIERFQYATSVLHCLPAGRAADGATTTGTVLRPAVVARLAGEAGFTGCAELPFPDRFHRAYRLLG